MAGEALPHSTQQKTAVSRVTGNQDQMARGCFTALSVMKISPFFKNAEAFLKKRIQRSFCNKVLRVIFPTPVTRISDPKFFTGIFQSIGNISFHPLII